MAQSFFFYDLETTGFDARSARIMQFAGQRTDLHMQPIGEPVNLFIKLTPDVLPSPDAIMVTGITPQQTLQDGLTEAEFMREFSQQVVLPDTIFVGFNSIRFDDEFMRFLHYRNFYDAYEWQWANGCSRWDILDVVRTTRALRPDGIEWPVDETGKAVNKLTSLTEANKLDHQNAHDALSDVNATIAVARLIHDKQPDLFNYLLGMRDKKKVAALVEADQPFVYVSGRYDSAFSCTSVAVRLAAHPQAGALVYDLRQDPTPFLNMSVDELVQAWQYTKDPDVLRLPVKTLKYNHCPAVAPMGVVKDQAVQDRLQLSLAAISKHLAILKQHKKAFAAKVLQAVAVMDKQRQTTHANDPLTVDGRLYDGFIGGEDKQLMRMVREGDPAELSDYADRLHDERLKQLLPLYKARNYPAQLSDEERAAWEEFCQKQLFVGGPGSGFAKYFKRLEELAASEGLDEQKRYLLEELQLYGQSILPADVTD